MRVTLLRTNAFIILFQAVYLYTKRNNRTNNNILYGATKCHSRDVKQLALKNCHYDGARGQRLVNIRARTYIYINKLKRIYRYGNLATICYRFVMILVYSTTDITNSIISGLSNVFPFYSLSTKSRCEKFFERLLLGDKPLQHRDSDRSSIERDLGISLPTSRNGQNSITWVIDKYSMTIVINIT